MKTTSFLLAATLLLPACVSKEDQPLLIFARTQNLGVNMAGNVPEQGASLSVGYNDRNLAVVPVTTRKGEEIRSSQDSQNGRSKDALSILGQFEMKADQKAQSVGLGTFFATGTAAGKLSDGFSAKLGFGRMCYYKDDKLEKCGPVPVALTNKAQGTADKDGQTPPAQPAVNEPASATTTPQ